MTETSTYTDTDADNGGGESKVTLSRSDIRALETSAKEGRQAQRELAFFRAGIDPTDPKQSYFARGYDGDLDPDKIRAAATEAGFLTPTQSDPAQQATASEAEAAEARAAAIGGGAPGDSGAITFEAGKQALTEAFKTGGKEALLAKCREFGIPISGESV